MFRHKVGQSSLFPNESTSDCLKIQY